ncbi:recombinase family protein, partial [Enterococcus cecorum]
MQQDLQSQVQRLKENGCTKIYKEKKSGKQAKNRTELQALLNVVSANDTIIVTKIDRLARSITDLQATIQVINAKGATITFLDNALTFRPNQDDPMAMLMLNMLGSFAEFERSMIASRTQEGKQY